jgi:hypothetical protein
VASEEVYQNIFPEAIIISVMRHTLFIAFQDKNKVQILEKIRYFLYFVPNLIFVPFSRLKIYFWMKLNNAFKKQ